MGRSKENHPEQDNMAGVGFRKDETQIIIFVSIIFYSNNIITAYVLLSFRYIIIMLWNVLDRWATKVYPNNTKNQGEIDKAINIRLPTSPFDLFDMSYGHPSV